MKPHKSPISEEYLPIVHKERKKPSLISFDRFRKNQNRKEGFAMFGLDKNRTVDSLEKIMKTHINEVFDEDLEIEGVEIFGSRVTGNHKNASDLDVKVFYKGDYREDDVFNGLHDTLYIDGVIVDFFPVKVSEPA